MALKTSNKEYFMGILAVILFKYKSAEVINSVKSFVLIWAKSLFPLKSGAKMKK